VRALTLLSGSFLVVGGLNWLHVGLFEFDLVAEIFGESFGTTNAASRVVYILVGLAAVARIPALLRSLRDDSIVTVDPGRTGSLRPVVARSSNPNRSL
jgi:uncharacterized membrane protein YuzA (DUF378 family)